MSALRRCLDTVHACGFHALADRAEEVWQEDLWRHSQVVLERDALRAELDAVKNALSVLSQLTPRAVDARQAGVQSDKE